MPVVKVPQLAWHGVKGLDLEIPDQYNVEVLNMYGWDTPPLLPAQIRAAIRFPIETPPIRTSAKGKKQIVIIFDDIQRSTRTAEIVPFVLEELAAAGIRDEQIRFIGASGLHAAMNRVDFVKKLGEDVVARFPVFNHNAFGCCTEIGTNSFGVKLKINAEVMQCDYKIAIGSVVPHAFAGFGGGAKIILPGLCHFDTVVAFHSLGSRFKREHPETPIGTGIIEDNLLRKNMEEAASLVGLDMKIDTLMNSLGETSGIFVGSLDKEYPRALQAAVNHYDTPPTGNNDIVIANSFAKAAECESGLEIAIAALKPVGGKVILIGNAPDGHVSHYLAGPWGKHNLSPLQMQVALPAKVKQLIIFSEYPDQTLLGYFAEPQRVKIISRWADVAQNLKNEYPSSAKVAVFPNADIQYCSAQKGTSILSFEEG
jgi:lactate racemase